MNSLSTFPGKLETEKAKGAFLGLGIATKTCITYRTENLGITYWPLPLQKRWPDTDSKDLKR